MNTQARVALAKEKHPERYCPQPKCLWMTRGGYCPRHKRETPAQKVDAMLETVAWLLFGVPYAQLEPKQADAVLYEASLRFDLNLIAAVDAEEKR